MASEHGSNSCDDSDCIYCGSSLDDPRSLNDKVLSDISCSKSGSQPLLHQDHGIETTSSQNLPSSSNQQLGTESSSFQDSKPEKIDSIVSELYSPRALVLQESILNQDAFSLSQQPVESSTREIQGFQQVPENIKSNNPTERHSSHSPYSVAQQQSKKRSLEVQHAIRRSIAIRARNTLLDRFLDVCIANDQNKSFHQSFSWANHYDLGMLQHPYANKSETMNILVCGPVFWTSQLIETFSRGLPVLYKSPFSLVLQRNVTRCGTLTSVSVWQVSDLNNSIQLLKSCVSSKTTIMCVFNETEERLQPMIELIRREVSHSVPIVLVWCNNKYFATTTILKFTKTGFQLKAKYDLSAFLVCYVHSVEEIDSVFFTAIDVSPLHTM